MGKATSGIDEAESVAAARSPSLNASLAPSPGDWNLRRELGVPAGVTEGDEEAADITAPFVLVMPFECEGEIGVISTDMFRAPTFPRALPVTLRASAPVNSWICL